MALSRTAHTVSTSTASGTSHTTGSYTFANGSFVVVIGQFINDGGSENPGDLFSIDDTGADLTWTKRVFAGPGNSPDYAGAASIWTATGNGTPCTLTITKTGNAVGA